MTSQLSLIHKYTNKHTLYTNGTFIKALPSDWKGDTLKINVFPNSCLMQETSTHVEQRSFYHFTQLLNLLLAATNIAVSHIWFLLNLHHGDCGVNLGGQRDVDLVLVAVHTVTYSTTTVLILPIIFYTLSSLDN